MTVRVASALALVSINLCFAQENFDSSFQETSLDTTSMVISVSQEDESPNLQAQEFDPTTTAPILAPLSVKEWSETASLEPFRFGAVTNKRVRMRTAAQLDAPVIKELDKGTPLKITSEIAEFYAVIPPFPMKAYIFRTYVLDGKIEGDRVNVRLGPSADAPILTQLSNGYCVNGKPSSVNAKWLEIDLPTTTRFYISRDYVQIIDEKEFQDLAKNFHSPIQAENSIKKVAASSETKAIKNEESSENALGVTVINEVVSKRVSKTSSKEEKHPLSSPALNSWQIQEQNIQNQWLLLNAPSSTENYQDFLDACAGRIKGTLSIYHAPSDAPGNFILSENGKIIAIIYSANLDLTPYLEQTIEVKAVQRDNHNYAYPAFCVLEVL